MAFTIAVSGKGGAGKTTMAGLIIRRLTEKGAAVLAVDADPNSCLGQYLGVAPKRTIADIREDAIQQRLAVSPGVPKERIIQYELQACVLESRKFDFIAMGRPEGPKCYCYVNHLLREYLDQLAGDYPFVVVDNEAGMEHLSRRTTNDVDVLLAVAEPTVIGLQTIERIFKLADTLPIVVRRREVVLNKVPPEAPNPWEEQVRALGAAVVESVPYDDAVYRDSLAGKTAFDFGTENEVYRRVAALADRLAATKRP